MTSTLSCPWRAISTSAAFIANQDQPFTPLAGLQAQLDKVSPSAQPGAVLTYRLQLQSMHAPAVRMDPCLPYRVRLVNHTTRAVLFEEDFVLNCGSPPTTVFDPASRHATYFDLRYDVPADAPSGDYDLIWQSVLKPVNAVADDVVHIQNGLNPCVDGQLRASAGVSGAATGHYEQVIVFRNVSDAACTLRGYPGLELLSKDGTTLSPRPKRGSDFTFQDPGPHLLVLAAKGGSASFSVGGADYDPVNQRACPTGTHMAVYAPETRARLLVAVGFPVCSTGVHFSAVVSGTNGAR